MSTLELHWVGDLPPTERKETNKHLRPPLIEFKPDKREIVIGRDNTKQPPDHCLESSVNSRMVSRRHASIERTPHGFMIHDHSLNGTYVNFIRISGGILLKRNDTICFGHLNGANIKPGQKVPDYFSDLKYRIEINDKKGAGDPKRKKSPSKVGGVRSSSPFDSSDSDAKTSSKKKVSSKKGDTTKSSDSDTSSSSSLGSDNEDLTMRLSTGKGSGARGGKQNGTKRKSSLLDSKASKPKRKSELTAGPASLGKERKKKPKSTTGGGPVPPMFHYDNEECAAQPCTHPEDDAIDWIQCDRCTKWYHQVCVGVEDDEKNSNTYFCPKCKK